MSTRIYGTSDDLIELEGDVSGEVGAFGTDRDERGVLLVCSDGTVLEIKYGKAGEAIWEIKLLKRGALFSHLDLCTSEDADPHSDVAHFQNGMKWVYAARDWELVK